MTRFGLIILFLAATVLSARKPNVLFLAVDDMNDWISTLGGYSGKVHTPNLERLGRLGVAFTNAHTASPVCCPSRTAVMLGLRPSTSGVYDNGQWWRPQLPDAVSLPMHFFEARLRNHGIGEDLPSYRGVQPARPVG